MTTTSPHTDPAGTPEDDLRTLRAELEWQREGDAVLGTLASLLLDAPDVEDIAGLALDAAKRLTGSVFGFCGVIDGQSGHLVCHTMTRDVWDACNVPDKAIVFKEYAGLWGWALKHKTPLMTNDPAADPRSTGVPEGHIPIENFLAHPALAGGRLVGQIALANAPGGYGEREMRLIARLSTLFALAIQQHHVRGRLHEERARAQRANKAKTELLARVSHEMRTPLNAILGQAENLLSGGTDGGTDRGGEQSLRAILEAGRQLLHNVERLVDYAQGESEQGAAERAPFALRETLCDAAGAYAGLAADKGLAFSCDLDAGVPERAEGDAPRLRHIVSELVDNAVRCTERGSVSVTASVDGDGRDDGRFLLRVRVADTGSGMDRERLAGVFEGVGNVAGLATGTAGLGIGLPMSRRFARLLGGDLTARSTRGEGSVFELVLPLGRSTGPAEAAPDAAATLELLLVEDNDTNVRVVEVYARRLGHRLSVACNGHEALDALRGQDFDVVLMDLEMPDMDGVEATRRIRDGEAGEAARNVPVAVMTAHALGDYRRRAEDAGMDRFLTKPVGFRTFKDLLDDLPSVDGRRGGEPGGAPPPQGEAPAGPALELDFTEVLANLEGDEALLDDLLALFLKNGAQHRAGLNTAVLARDADAAGRAAHSLKGNAATVGIGVLSAAARDLHDLILDGAWAEAEAALPGFLDLLDAATGAVEAYRDGGE